MADFYRTGGTLPYPKTDLSSIGAGDPTQYVSAADWNAVCQAIVDGQAALIERVSTVATLKSSVNPAVCTVAFVAGYAAAHDGGEGVFLWVSGDSTADNGGSVLASTYPGAPSGRWMRPAAPQNVKWFGAKGDGSTDDSVAVQAASDAAHQLGQALYFPGSSTEYVIGGASSSATWGDAYGGVKLYSGMVVFGDGMERTRVKKGANPCNYVWRFINESGLEIRHLTWDIAADVNFRSGLYLQDCGRVWIHHCGMVSSLLPTAGWTVHAVLPFTTQGVRIEHCRAARCQILGGGDGSAVSIQYCTSVNAFNQGISCVTASDTTLRGLSIVGNHVEGAMDSGIYWGADGGTSVGTFDDVDVRGNTVDGFATNRGIFGRYGLHNKNWIVETNTVRGGGSKSCTLASSYAAGVSSVAVTAGQGTGCPTSGKLFLGLGTLVEEVFHYTRSTDTFTLDRATKYAHASGSDLWLLTDVVPNNTIGIEVSIADDLLGGPMSNLQVKDNDVSNVDLPGIRLYPSTDLLSAAVDGNHLTACRGIEVAGGSGFVWRALSVSGNRASACGNYGVRVSAGGAAQGKVLVEGNVVQDVSGSFAGMSFEAGSGGSVQVHAVGNLVKGCYKAVAEVTSGGGTVDAAYIGNNFKDNTNAPTVAGSAIARSNRGLADQGSLD